MEKVQLSLERFLPELRDLERKKVFSKDEISELVAKRRAFEISLSSRDVKPIHYLRYIEYEIKLEKLRKLRANRLQTTTKKTLSDHSIQAHITQLHKLSTRRFPASLTLWDASLAHSLTLDSPLLVSKTLSACIAMHPTQVSYWIMASRWESEGDRKGMGGGNVEGARRLCMRALRFLKNAPGEMTIWREWIRLEVAFLERVRGRAQVLGTGKQVGGGEVIVRVGEKSTDEMDLDPSEEEGPADVQVPLLPDETVGATDETMQHVSALSGQDAIIDGAIVRVVLENCLSSFLFSLEAHQAMIILLRTLPTLIRLPLLNHVYSSIRAHFPPTAPLYAAATHLLATRPLYDVAYDPKTSEPKVSLNVGDDVPTESTVRVEGEALVDAVGEIVDEYWKACKGKKGKGKGKEQASIAVWESFCGWLEEAEEASEDENLTIFLTSNLTTALSIAPPSASLLLLHLRHLLRTTAPHPTILSFAKFLTTRFGQTSLPETREEIWVARVETVVALGTDEEAAEVFAEVERALPFSGRVWAVAADWIERSGTEDVGAWYEKNINRVLLTDAIIPLDFISKFDSTGPRELLPMRYITYLLTQDPTIVPKKLNSLLLAAPTLPITFLSYVLSLVLPGLSPAIESAFRKSVHSRIVDHPDATSIEWVAFAGELLNRGEIIESNKVMQRATRACKGHDGKRLQAMWSKVCDA